MHHFTDQAADVGKVLGARDGWRRRELQAVFLWFGRRHGFRPNHTARRAGKSSEAAARIRSLLVTVITSSNEMLQLYAPRRLGALLP